MVLGMPTLRVQVMLVNTRTTREAEQHSREAALEASVAASGGPAWEQRAAQAAAASRGGGGGGGNSGGGGSGRSSHSGTGPGAGGATAPPPLHTVTMTPKWQVQNRVGGGGLYNLDGTAPHSTAGLGTGAGTGLGASLQSVGSSQHANGTASGPGAGAGGGAAAGARSEAVDLVYLRNVLLKFLEAHAAGRSQERDLLLPAVATLLQVGRGHVWGCGAVSRSVRACVRLGWVDPGCCRRPGICVDALGCIDQGQRSGACVVIGCWAGGVQRLGRLWMRGFVTSSGWCAGAMAQRQLRSVQKACVTTARCQEHSSVAPVQRRCQGWHSRCRSPTIICEKCTFSCPNAGKPGGARSAAEGGQGSSAAQAVVDLTVVGAKEQLHLMALVVVECQTEPAAACAVREQWGEGLR